MKGGQGSGCGRTSALLRKAATSAAGVARACQPPHTWQEEEEEVGPRWVGAEARRATRPSMAPPPHLPAQDSQQDGPRPGRAARRISPPRSLSSPPIIGGMLWGQAGVEAQRREVPTEGAGAAQRAVRRRHAQAHGRCKRRRLRVQRAELPGHRSVVVVAGG